MLFMGMRTLINWALAIPSSLAPRLWLDFPLIGKVPIGFAKIAVLAVGSFGISVLLD